MKSKSEIFVFAAIVTGITIGIAYMGNHTAISNFEDAALGKATVSHYAEDNNGNKIHYLPKHDIENFINGIQPYLNNKTALYLGNSQSHSINQKKDDDNTMSGFLFNDLIKDSITFLTASIPNANLQEHYLLYNLFNQNIPHIDLLVIPVFMDDLRETGIRENYFKNFNDSTYFISDENDLAEEINDNLIKFEQKKSDTLVNNQQDFKALNKTTQENVEHFLNDLLNRNFSFWKNREEIRGEYFTALYRGRNSMLNISSQTIRKMIKSRYQKNLNALKLIIEKAQKNNTQVLLVIPPIRQDIKYPYDLYEYKNFKNEMAKISEHYHIKLIDIDYIIDGKYWGYSAPTQLFKDKDYDFMHFQSDAHKILADTLKPHILHEL